MSRFGDTDLPVFFTDFAVPIIYGGVTKMGIVDYNDAENPEGGTVRILDRITQVTLPYNAFPAMTRESDVTVDGVAMKVRDIVQSNDGGIVGFWAVLP